MDLVDKKPDFIKDLTKMAQELRKNPTREERHLWYDFLKTLPLNFNRQKVIGNYIVDFYCSSAKLVIELDGSQHYNNDISIKKDIERDKFLKEVFGLKVLRYSNYEVNKNFKGVCEDIYNNLHL